MSSRSRGAGVRALAGVGALPAGERRRLGASVALSAGATAAAVALLATSGYLISRAAQRPQILELMVAIVAVRAFGLLRALLRYAERLVSHDLALRQLERLRVRFYERLAPLVPGGLRRGGGDMLARFVGDVDALSDLYLRSLIPLLVAGAVIAGASVAAWIMLPAAGAAVLCSLLAAAIAVPWLGASAAARSDRRQAAARARLTGELVEAIDGAEELQMSGCAPARLEALGAGSEELTRLARIDARAAAVVAALGGVLSGAGLLLVLVVGVTAVHAGSLSGVLLAALAFLLLASYEGVSPLPAAARSLRSCAAAAVRVEDVSDRAAQVLDPPCPLHPPGGGELRADGLRFAYGDAEEPLFDGLCLSLARGERVALCGPSGAGKSTLAELLVRFRDPTAGSVTLDGVDVRRMTQEDLRSAVVLCGQEAHLFNTSVRENLRVARPQAGEQEILDALRIVELQEWAQALPEGLDTLVGAEGELVSGGQRQRLALARALLADARFLILDEPTAHLDVELARRVMANVASTRPDCGMLVITHEPSLLGACERVVEL